MTIARLAFFFSLFFPSLLPAQPHYFTDAVARGQGNISVTNCNTWAVSANPACLAKVKGTTFGAAYENPYLLPSLSHQLISFSRQIDRGSLGLMAAQFGNSLFRSREMILSFGRQLSEQLCMGVGLTWHRLVLGEYYGSKNNLLANMGIFLRLSEQLLLGAHAHNLNNARLTDFNDERLLSTQRVGLTYLLSDITRLLAEIEKDSRSKANFKFGINYQPARTLFLRAGINTFPPAVCFGLGVKMKDLLFNMAFSFHPVTGYYPSLSLTWPSGEDEH